MPSLYINVQGRLRFLLKRVCFILVSNCKRIFALYWWLERKTTFALYSLWKGKWDFTSYWRRNGKRTLALYWRSKEKRTLALFYMKMTMNPFLFRLSNEKRVKRILKKAKAEVSLITTHLAITEKKSSFVSHRANSHMKS